jgi:hypothetical protein
VQSSRGLFMPADCYIVLRPLGSFLLSKVGEGCTLCDQGLWACSLTCQNSLRTSASP